MKDSQTIRRMVTRRHPLSHQRDQHLPMVLWGLWTLTGVAVGIGFWWPTVVAQQPLPIIDLILRCTFTGLFGMIVITLIEQHLEPWRYSDSAPRIR